MVPARDHADDALRLRRGAVRLVHGRDRTPALRRLWAIAHGRRPFARSARGGDGIARGLPDRLCDHLQFRQLLSRQAAAARARAVGADVRGRHLQDAEASVLDAEREPGRPPRPARPAGGIGEAAMFGFGTEYEGLAFWLPLIWAGLIAVAVAMYVVMDGFDLGVGILFNAAGSENWRDRMMISVAPIWDGNETWLILG